MYDCIVQALGTLPAGVELIEVLEEAAEAEVAEVMAAMPRKGDQLSAQDMVAAGEAWSGPLCAPSVGSECQLWSLSMRSEMSCHRARRGSYPTAQLSGDRLGLWPTFRRCWGLHCFEEAAEALG